VPPQETKVEIKEVVVHDYSAESVQELQDQIVELRAAHIAELEELKLSYETQVADRLDELEREKEKLE